MFLSSFVLCFSLQHIIWVCAAKFHAAGTQTRHRMQMMAPSAENHARHMQRASACMATVLIAIGVFHMHLLSPTCTLIILHVCLINSQLKVKQEQFASTSCLLN